VVIRRSHDRTIARWPRIARSPRADAAGRNGEVIRPPHDRPMAPGGRRVDRANDRAREIRRRIGLEIRSARRGSGLSLRSAGSAVGISASAFGRIERGVEAGVSVQRLCLACAAVGLAFNGRSFLDGDPVRDAGHVALLSRARAVLPAGAPWRLEAPLAGGDGRAIDAVTRLDGTPVGFEAETRLEDIQALLRRLGLKRRDGPIDRLVLVIADTRHNRAAVQAYAAELRTVLPIGPRRMLAALRAGECPSGDGYVVL
jgi:transcriptional regulator with XRE-family HTH domain